MKALEKNAAVISVILAKLLDIGINDDFVDDTDIDVDNDLRDMVKPCMEWLANEGLVRWANTAHSSSGATWVGPVLTSRGIAIMGARLEVDGQTVTIAEYVTHPSKTKGSFTVIGDFLGSALGGYTKSMMS
ncbi:hypothetical protein [Yoonia sp. I 8.24]|uniref:hypothetical protein n=1 Tax=Yoonia sp. I 8.24 TaxID=1537229 RepID=UPI001EDE18A5|nr:hypothetical protein [Yoonia sp. I 8.24]MCG3266735.1 hypothetical protein [Yoonia sp. I 8.24]